MGNARFLVIGASGLVGRCLTDRLRKHGAFVVGTYASRPGAQLRRLDIMDPSQIGACLAETRPQAIFLTAALTHVDYCEDHGEEARRINVLGPCRVAEHARREGAKLVFYSTEYVFDGVDGPYDEEATPNPMSVYGRTKLEAENAILQIVPEALILRTTVVFGWDPESKNFAMQIYDRVQRGLEITVPHDQLGSPTWVGFLADVSLRLVEQGVSGIVNVVGKDIVPRTEFARALIKLFGGKPERVIPVSTASLRQKAARPLRGGLQTGKLRELLGQEPISLEESLQRLKLEWQQNL